MTKSFSPLICDRVSLQPVCENDITNEYVEWLNNPEVVRFSNQRFVNHSIESSLHYLHSFTDTENLYLSIKDIVTKRLIGSLTAYIDSNHGTADMGLMIGNPEVWGKGFGFEAWTKLMEYLLNTEKIRKVTGGTLATNLGMVKIMERSGMHLEATRYKQEIVDGSPVDILYFARFNDKTSDA